MTILCGTDFSKSSSQAALAACAIAPRLGLPLELVRVIDDGASLLASASQSEALYPSAQARLRDEAGVLEQQTGEASAPASSWGAWRNVLLRARPSVPVFLSSVQSLYRARYRDPL